MKNASPQKPKAPDTVPTLKLYLFSENGLDCLPTGKKIEHRAYNFLEAFQTFAPLVNGKQTKQKYLIVCPDKTYWTGEKY